MSPEVGDGIAAVTTTWQDLESTAALAIGTLFALLFLPRFVTDGWTERHSRPRVQGTSLGADQDTQTRLLEDVDIVVVGVPHGPTAGVTSCLLTVRCIDVPRVAICPLVEVIVSSHLDIKGIPFSVAVVHGLLSGTSRKLPVLLFRGG